MLKEAGEVIFLDTDPSMSFMLTFQLEIKTFENNLF